MCIYNNIPYLHIYMHIYIYIYASINIHIYMYPHTHVYIYIIMYIHFKLSKHERHIYTILYTCNIYIYTHMLCI